MSLQELSTKVAEMEERCILYRTSGWTVFEMDLDVGKRQRNARRQINIDAKTALGLGVRLETFYEGRFYEPYYLIFAKSSQLVKKEAKTMAPFLDDTKQEKTSTHNQHAVRLMRHTIPHFIPLSDLLQAYLSPELDVEDINIEEENKEKGGLELLDGLMSREGLSFFLSQLHAYLQSFVSRRQQAIALAELPLPGLMQSSLRAFGNDSFGQLTARWDLPTPTQKDLQMFEQHGDLLYANTDSNGHANVEPLMHQKNQGSVNTLLEISIIYHNLSNDRPGVPVKQVSARQEKIQALTDDQVMGLKCTFATVLVEVVRSRVPAPRRGDTEDNKEKLQIKRTRKAEWESSFTQPYDSPPDLQKALGDILQLASTLR